MESDTVMQEVPVAPLQAPQSQAQPQTPEAESSKSFILPKDFKPAAVKLDNIEHLEGQQNYEDWASQMAMVISKPILKKVSKDTAFSFVHQVAGLCLLSTKIEKGKPVSEFMNKFDDQWNRVYKMAAGFDPYCQKFRAFLEEDYAKRDFLLAALSEHYLNPVDNLTTKTDLTYAEARHRMHSLSSNQLEGKANDIALIAGNSTPTASAMVELRKGNSGKATGGSNEIRSARKIK